MTLNEYVNIYRNFTKDHLVLKSFYIGNPDHFGNDKAHVYPALIMTINPTTVNEMTIDLKAQFIVLNRIVDEGDLLEVHNETDLICRDIIAISNQVSTADPVQTDINHSDTEKRYNDMVAGSWCDVSVEVFGTVNACSLPIDNTPYPTPGGANILNQFGVVIATLYAGQSYTVEELQQIVQTLTDPAPVTITQTLS